VGNLSCFVSFLAEDVVINIKALKLKIDDFFIVINKFQEITKINTGLKFEILNRLLEGNRIPFRGEEKSSLIGMLF
jgi:hypothetical protein